MKVKAIVDNKWERGAYLAIEHLQQSRVSNRQTCTTVRRRSEWKVGWLITGTQAEWFLGPMKCALLPIRGRRAYSLKWYIKPTGLLTRQSWKKRGKKKGELRTPDGNEIKYHNTIPFYSALNFVGTQISCQRTAIGWFHNNWMVSQLCLAPQKNTLALFEY